MLGDKWAVFFCVARLGHAFLLYEEAIYMKERMRMAVAALISPMMVLNTMVITPMTVSAAAVDELDGAAEN